MPVAYLTLATDSFVFLTIRHRATKRRVNAKQGLREFQAARRTIQGYEAMNVIRKGQVRWLSGRGILSQNRFINELFEVAT
jgi:IS6 family transposase